MLQSSYDFELPRVVKSMIDKANHSILGILSCNNYFQDDMHTKNKTKKKKSYPFLPLRVINN